MLVIKIQGEIRTNFITIVFNEETCLKLERKIWEQDGKILAAKWLNKLKILMHKH